MHCLHGTAQRELAVQKRWAAVAAHQWLGCQPITVEGAGTRPGDICRENVCPSAKEGHLPVLSSGSGSMAPLTKRNAVPCTWDTHYQCKQAAVMVSAMFLYCQEVLATGVFPCAQLLQLE